MPTLGDWPCSTFATAGDMVSHSPYYLCRYEMRRQCQEILPRLYLGPLQASKSLETLQSLGITHMYVRIQRISHVFTEMQHEWRPNSVFAYGMRRRRSLYDHGFLSISNTWCWMCRIARNRTSSAYSPSTSGVHLYPCVNITPYSASGICCRAKQYIDDAIAQGGCVLVHCNGARHDGRNAFAVLTSKFSPSTGGISLSPAFVVMYVMQHHGLSWEDALHLVQNRRYCISPNGGFLTQIKVGRPSSRIGRSY